jgi:hypothetical protein
MKSMRVLLITFVLLVGIGVFCKLFVGVERIDAGCVGIKVNLVGDNRGVDDITEVTG